MDEDRIVREPELSEMTGLPPTSRRLLVRQGKFPKPLKTGQRRRGWLLSEVQAWLRERAAEREN